MTTLQTLILAAVGVLLAALCGWRGARPPDPRRGPRLAPWRFLMLLFAAGVFFLLLHLMQQVRSGG